MFRCLVFFWFSLGYFLRFSECFSVNSGFCIYIHIRAYYHISTIFWALANGPPSTKLPPPLAQTSIFATGCERPKESFNLSLFQAQKSKMEEMTKDSDEQKRRLGEMEASLSLANAEKLKLEQLSRELESSSNEKHATFSKALTGEDACGHRPPRSVW